jgi:hypothetical protein
MSISRMSRDDAPQSSCSADHQYLSGTEITGSSLNREECQKDRHYEPVAWWFTRRRLGREIRNSYDEELPPRLLTLISELDGKPEVSLADDVPALHL